MDTKTVQVFLSSLSLPLVGQSVHEVGGAAAQLHVFLPLERELNPGEPYQNQVESVEDENEEENPKAAVVALRVGLENKVLLPEVGDELGEAPDLHLGGEQDQNQAAGHTCRTNTRHQFRTRTGLDCRIQNYSGL